MGVVREGEYFSMQVMNWSSSGWKTLENTSNATEHKPSNLPNTKDFLENLDIPFFSCIQNYSNQVLGFTKKKASNKNWMILDWLDKFSLNY